MMRALKMGSAISANAGEPTTADARPAVRRGAGAALPGWVALAVILLLFGLLHNRFWSRGGDGDVYLGLSRSIALGEGYRCNSQPVAIVPPGWPIVLAGAMRIDPSFAFLKLVPMLLLAGAFLVWYRILLRLASPALAAAIVIVGALLAPVLILSFNFLAEGLFCLTSGLSIWIALQINESRSIGWRLPVLLALCAASVSVRWAGLLWWPLVAGALLRGHLRPHFDKRWIAIVLTLLITLGAFFAQRRLLRVSPDQIDPRFNDSLAIPYDLFNKAPTIADYAQRILAGGGWLTGLIVQPLRDAGRPGRALGDIAGTILFILLLMAIGRAALRRDWLLAAVILYVGYLVIDWPAPVGRYLVPLVPLLLLAIYLEGRRIGKWLDRRLGFRIASTLVTIGVAGVIVVNVAFAAVEIDVARSRDYYSIYQAGLNRSLVQAAHWLTQQGINDGDVALNRIDENLNRVRFSNGWMTATNVLLNRGVRTVPDELTGAVNADGDITPTDPLAAPIIQWLHDNNVRYYLYRPPSQTFWHFHRWDIPIGHAVAPRDYDESWRLYRIDGLRAERIIPPAAKDWPLVVPGF
jgi:hypothetical protein